MTKQEALELLTRVLPFGGEGEDYQSSLDGTGLSNIDELVKHLEEDFGEFIVDAYDPATGESGLVYIESDMSDTLYKAPSPCGLTLQVMEALYTLTP